VISKPLIAQSKQYPAILPNSLLLLVLLLTVSCDDHGLAPVPSEKPGFGGTITVVSAWPPADSLVDLRVVAFEKYPPENILLEVASGRALISAPLQFNIERQSYTIPADGIAKTYKYIAVAHQYGDSLMTNWRAVGVYSAEGLPEQPYEIALDGSRFLGDVDIKVDFYNLPPQPF